MLITPSSWKRLEYGNFSLGREYKSPLAGACPWLKQSKLKSQSNIFHRDRRDLWFHM